LDGNESKYAEQREVKKVLLVAIVSNRGLGGRLQHASVPPEW
jgi:F0F1-type ATP synthase gamma subunit